MTTSLLERVEMLEKQNRRLQRTGLVFLVVAGAALLIGQAKPQWKVEAQTFILQDADGKVRAELGMTQYGPALAMYDEDGRTRRVALGIAEKGPGLFIFDRTQKRRAVFGEAETGPVLGLFDEDGKTLFLQPEKAMRAR